MKLKNEMITVVGDTEGVNLDVPFVAIEADQDESLIFIEDALTPEEALDSVFDESDDWE